MTDKSNSSSVYRGILVIFFFSGIAGLAYQVIWGKLLAQIFGHTIYAISTVVATFMAGLALGSYFFGKKADHTASPLRLYAKLEFGIGLYALIFLFLFSYLDGIYGALFNYFDLGFSTFSVSRLFYAFFLLIIPTSLIGGTFPVISKYVIREAGKVREGSGYLYAFNTAGAVTGALLTGFLLLEWVGIAITTYLMVVINLTLGIIAWNLEERKEYPPLQAIKEKQENPFSFVLIIYALAGFVSLALEVLWTRELTIVFLSSTYSFSTVLVTFLVGLTAGSWFFSRKKSVKEPLSYFYRIEFGIAVTALLSLPLLRFLPQQFYIQRVMSGSISWEIELLLNFAVSFAVLIFPTFLMGAAFPLVCTICSRSEAQIGTDIGRVYAYNTLGAIFGSLTAGFILIPLLGVVKSILAVSIFSFILVAVLIIKYVPARRMGLEHLFMLIFFLLSLFVVAERTGSFRPLQAGMKVIYSKEDISAEVKVLQDEQGERSLYINEKQQGGTRVTQTERWTGQVPLVFQSNPDSVLVIGLGTGVTLNALTEGPVKHVTCVDLIGSLVEAADQFEMINDAVLHHADKVSFVEADGINYLNLTRNRFNLILCDIVHPDDAGAGDLYSIDFYRICKAGLKEDGLFIQWILLDQLAPSDLKVILATFYHVFPDVQIFLGQEQTIHQKLMLIGSRGTLRWDVESISENLRHLPFTDEFPGGRDPYSFLSYFVSSGSLLKDLIADTEINSRDHPVIEFQSPRHRWLPGKSIVNLNLLRNLRIPLSKATRLTTASDSLLKTYFNTRSLLLQGRIQEYYGRYAQADTSYSLAALRDVDTLLVSYLLEQNAGNLVSARRTDMAVTAFKKSIAVNHHNTRASYALAEYLLQLGREDEAIEFFRYTAFYDQQDYQALRRLGDIYTKKNDFDSAFDYYHESVMRHDEQPILHYILGQIYANYRNDPAMALKSFRKSLQLNPYHHYNQRAKKAIASLEDIE